MHKAQSVQASLTPTAQTSYILHDIHAHAVHTRAPTPHATSHLEFELDFTCVRFVASFPTCPAPSHYIDFLQDIIPTRGNNDSVFFRRAVTRFITCRSDITVLSVCVGTTYVYAF